MLDIRLEAIVRLEAIDSRLEAIAATCDMTLSVPDRLAVGAQLAAAQRRWRSPATWGGPVVSRTRLKRLKGIKATLEVEGCWCFSLGGEPIIRLNRGVGGCWKSWVGVFAWHGHLVVECSSVTSTAVGWMCLELYPLLH